MQFFARNAGTLIQDFTLMDALNRIMRCGEIYSFNAFAAFVRRKK